MYQLGIQQPVTRSGRESRQGDAHSAHASTSIATRQRFVVALLHGRVARARIADALDRGTELDFVSTIDELRAAIRACRGTLTVVTEARDALGRPAAPLIRDLAATSPAVAIIGYCAADRCSRDLLDLANAGIDELIQENIDDAGVALRAAYAGSTESCAARAVRRALEGCVSQELRAMVDYCLQFPRDDHTVSGLARAVGVDRKTLLNYCGRTGFPPPSALAMWCRLFLSAKLLELTGAPVDQIVLQLNFASPSAFRNACRRYTGEKPSSWRTSGALERVVEHFKRTANITPHPA